ncbi:MAG: radical SAM protein [Methanotrichaceae archaeon]|nr:radical SAM protein [Methanotrichaceae archaeon]
MKYKRTPMTELQPFNPIQKSREVEKIVMQADNRMYYRFRFAKFYGGIATADTVGCNLLCAYCWNYFRNLKPSKTAPFYSPSEVTKKFKDLADKHKSSRFRISGAEPILGRVSTSHLAEVVKHIDGYFILETNGIMIGYDQTLVDILAPLPVYVRLCIKAHQGLDFEKITGAQANGLDYQLNAARYLEEAGISYSIAVMGGFVDPTKLPVRVTEVEDLILYKSTEKMLKERGF